MSARRARLCGWGARKVEFHTACQHQAFFFFFFSTDFFWLVQRTPPRRREHSFSTRKLESWENLLKWRDTDGVMCNRLTIHPDGLTILLFRTCRDFRDQLVCPSKFACRHITLHCSLSEGEVVNRGKLRCQRHAPSWLFIVVCHFCGIRCESYGAHSSSIQFGKETGTTSPVEKSNMLLS